MSANLALCLAQEPGLGFPLTRPRQDPRRLTLWLEIHPLLLTVIYDDRKKTDEETKGDSDGATGIAHWGVDKMAPGHQLSVALTLEGRETLTLNLTDIYVCTGVCYRGPLQSQVPRDWNAGALSKARCHFPLPPLSFGPGRHSPPPTCLSTAI